MGHSNFSYKSIPDADIVAWASKAARSNHILGHVSVSLGEGCSSVVTAFANGAMGNRIDPSWGGPIELFLVPASAPRLV